MSMLSSFGSNEPSKNAEKKKTLKISQSINVEWRTCDR